VTVVMLSYLFELVEILLKSQH